MSGLRWIRMDVSMFDNPKLLYLQEDKQFRAIVAHIQGMCYSAKHGLSGFIPKVALRVIGATPGDATKLVAADLWTPASGGWDINGWAEFQLAGEEAARRSEKAKKAAARRWANRNGGKLMLEQCLSICNQAMLGAMHVEQCTYVTYVRNEQLLTLSSNGYVGQRAQGGCGIRALSGRKSRAGAIEIELSTGEPEQLAVTHA